MLDELDSVPWRSLRHASGEATDVPRLIRALAATADSERQSALKELFACLLHQGTVNEATTRAVPFLFELLDDTRTPERNWIAFLVASIAQGKGSLALLIAMDERRLRGIFAERGTTLEAEREREERIVRAVQAEVSRNALLLIPHLNDSQSEIRAAVAKALGAFSARAADLVPALEAAEARETATDAREAMRVSLTALRGAATDARR